MKDEYYKKVVIESENDLPKEEGYYYIMEKSQSPENILYAYYSLEYKNYWIANVIWYLLPVDQEQEAHPKLCLLCKKRYLSDICLTCTQELCSTVDQEQPVQVTDEEIERHAHNIFALGNLISAYNLPVEISKLAEGLYCDGAKWVRDQLKPIDLREELVKFLKEYHKSMFVLDVATYIDYEHIIDEYLKPR